MITPPIAGDTTLVISLRSSRGIRCAIAHRIHQHPRTLQIVCRMPARRKQEVAFKQGLARAELGQNLFFLH
jgi:hypothetical protein